MTIDTAIVRQNEKFSMPEPRGGKAESVVPGSEADIRVMIVDDLQPIRRVVRRILEHTGYNVIGEAEDGDEAVILSDKLKPDLIVMDYAMGGMNGIEATRRIKDKNPHIKVVIMTGMPRPSLVIDSMKAGASNFLIKPVGAQQLLNVIRTATRDRTAQMTAERRKFVRSMKLEIDNAAPGMVLAEDVKNRAGGTILSADSILSESPS